MDGRECDENMYVVGRAFHLVLREPLEYEELLLKVLYTEGENII